jgi:TonB-dependent receptor
MKKNLTTKWLFFLLLLIVTPSLIRAQGALRGAVTDSVTNDRLIGATVAVVGTSLGAMTDVEGEYKISNIPVGKHQLKISYVGYRTKFVTVDIIDNQTKRVNLTIVVDAVNIHEVVVTGQARGQVAAINQQLGANTIVNVISEEKIQQLPDQNAAEAIGRLPGVSITRSGGEATKVVLRGLSDKFSTVTIDGIRMAPTDATSRGIDLSTISQGSLAGIELFKALTPDKDADAIAGSVNLVTKKAPELRSIRIDAKGDYNKMDKTTDQYDLSFKYGERFFDNLIGLQVTGNLERKIRSKENINYDYNMTTLSNGTDYEISNFTLDYTNEVRRRNGFSILLDINTPDSGSIRINNVFNGTNRNYIDYSRNYPTNGSTLTYAARDRETDIKTYNSSIRGENYLLGLTWTWGLSFAQSKMETPYDFDMEFLEPSSSVSHMKNIPTDYAKGPAEKIIEYAWNNFSLAYLNVSYDRKEKNLDREKTAFLDVEKKYNLSNWISGEFKLGGKYRYKSRFKEGSEYVAPYYIYDTGNYYTNADGTIVSKDWANSMFSHLQTNGSRILVTNFLDASPASRNVYEKYLLYPILNRSTLRAWRDLCVNGVYDATGSRSEYSRNYEADANYYDITENISSAYAMNSLHIGPDISFIAGLRVENEDNTYKSRYSPDGLSGFPAPQGTLRDTSSAHKETVWLPNFHLQIKATEFLNIRLAAYKAIARPDFNNRLENFIARSNGTLYSGNSLTIGNPNLKAAKAWNFEWNTSVFSNSIGLISISVFYKEITDMYHMINGITINGGTRTINGVKYNSGQLVLDSLGIKYKNPFGTNDFTLTYPYNSNKPTKVWGFEVEHQANLKFLPGLLSNIVLSYNFSFVKSETYITTSKLETYYVTIVGIPFPIEKSRTVMYEDRVRMEGQPELFGNIALGYEIGGFSARVSLFYQGEYNTVFSATQRSDKVQNEFQRWDLAVKQEINDHIAVLFNLNNFTNSEEGTSIKNRIMGWTLPDWSEKYGVTADLGVKITF